MKNRKLPDIFENCLNQALIFFFLYKNVSRAKNRVILAILARTRNMKPSAQCRRK